MSKTVLVVDDATFMRKMLSDILTKNNFEVVDQAADGNEAVHKYLQLKPDIVTMDITMPDKDGIQALKEILEINPEAVVIMCSAMSQQRMVLEALNLGAKDFITKPFRPDQVIESINKSFKK